jgi:cysteine desulfurase/selenocysteine lyase
MLDVKRIRQDFPYFQTKNPAIYLDNACMTLKPLQVIDAITEYYQTYPACAGRSNHRLAKRVTDAVSQARTSIKKLINAKNDSEIVFTRNATEGINLLSLSLGLKVDDVVLVGDKEHNSNLVPWLRLAKTRGVRVEIVPSTETNEFDLQAWQTAIKKHLPKVVAVGMVSNLDGVSAPIKELAQLVHAHHGIIIVDGAQAVPHQQVNVVDLDIDFLVFSVHKMCGPTGMGVLYGKTARLEALDPFLVGGDTVSRTSYTDYELLPVPERFEAGLQNYAGIIGSGAAADYLLSLGLDAIGAHLAELNALVTQALKDEDRVHLIGPSDPSKRSGIFSFTVDGVDSHQVALMLDQMSGIAVRSGQHCVHSWFDNRQIHSSVRASFYLYSSEADVETFVETLQKIIRVI